MSFSEALVYIAGIAGLATIAVYFVRGIWPAPERAELEQRALAELALLRDEVSKLRAETLKDREEIRTELAKHERGFVNVTHQVNDCIRETSKLSLAYGQAAGRPR